jgi:hypothetical protein
MERGILLKGRYVLLHQLQSSMIPGSVQISLCESVTGFVQYKVFKVAFAILKVLSNGAGGGPKPVSIDPFW